MSYFQDGGHDVMTSTHHCLPSMYDIIGLL